jgi:hypothetical protein
MAYASFRGLWRCANPRSTRRAKRSTRASLCRRLRPSQPATEWINLRGRSFLASDKRARNLNGALREVGAPCPHRELCGTAAYFTRLRRDTSSLQNVRPSKTETTSIPATSQNACVTPCHYHACNCQSRSCQSRSCQSRSCQAADCQNVWRKQPRFPSGLVQGEQLPDSRGGRFLTNGRVIVRALDEAFNAMGTSKRAAMGEFAVVQSGCAFILSGRVVSCFTSFSRATHGAAYALFVQIRTMPDGKLLRAVRCRRRPCGPMATLAARARIIRRIWSLRCRDGQLWSRAIASPCRRNRVVAVFADGSLMIAAHCQL